MNYNATFDFTKKESSYIAGSVYFVSMIFAPVLGLIVVSQIDTKTNASLEIVIKAAIRTGIDI